MSPSRWVSNQQMVSCSLDLVLVTDQVKYVVKGVRTTLFLAPSWMWVVWSFVDSREHHTSHYLVAEDD